MNGEKINLTKGGGEESIFNIPNNGEVISLGKAKKQENDLYEAYEDEESYNNSTSETRKESAEAEEKIIAFRRVARLRGQKVFRILNLEKSLEKVA